MILLCTALLPSFYNIKKRNDIKCQNEKSLNKYAQIKKHSSQKIKTVNANSIVSGGSCKKSCTEDARG
jgi:hypothetical protein